MRSSKSPFFTVSPSFTNKSTISPETSEEIITSTSGCTFPLAETISVMSRFIAFSVATFSVSFPEPFFQITTTMSSASRIPPIIIKRFMFCKSECKWIALVIIENFHSENVIVFRLNEIGLRFFQSVFRRVVINCIHRAEIEFFLHVLERFLRSINRFLRSLIFQKSGLRIGISLLNVFQQLLFGKINAELRVFPLNFRFRNVGVRLKMI